MKAREIYKAIILSGAFLPFFASALETPPVIPLNIDFFMDILGRLVIWTFSFFMVLAVIMLIIAAFKYLTSGGDAGRVKEATRAVVFAIVAIAVALLAASVRFLVASLLNISFG